MARIMLIATVVFLLLFSVTAAEQIYPAGSAVLVDYSLSDTLTVVNDSIVIVRQLVNNESFNLSGLFFSEHLPPEMEVTSYSVTLNSSPLQTVFSGPLINVIETLMVSHYWLVDSPAADSVALTSLAPGDTISLRIHVTCNLAGVYQLPLHTTAFYGNSQPFFATDSSSPNIHVVPVVSVGDDDRPETLPDRMLLSQAYPNPFNGPVRIYFDGISSGSRNVNLMIYDLLGRLIYKENQPVSGIQGYIDWEPSLAGSGIYFYRLSDGMQITSGKLMLLK